MPSALTPTSASSGSQRSRSSAGSAPRTVMPRRSGIVCISPVTGFSVISERCTRNSVPCPARRNSAAARRPVGGPSAIEIRSRPSPGSTSMCNGRVSPAVFDNGAGRVLDRPSSGESILNWARPSFSVTAAV